MNKKKIGLISLGCDKNRVDSEKMLYTIKDFAEITNDIQKAEIIIINSCGFLCESRQEAIETVLDCNSLRDGVLEKIVLTGCLPQKFIDELYDELIEVDLFLGVNDYDLLQEGIAEIYKNKRVNLVCKGNFNQTGRVLTTPEHYAYLKVADGCKNHCTYCLIPYIRGKLKSTPIEELKQEVLQLGEVKELILVAQDLTAYGLDIYGKPSLVRLIQELSQMESVGSIRLLYCYPELIDDDLIEEIKLNDKVIKYIDVPMQHADDSVLKRMNRKGTKESYLKLVEKLKQIPDMVIRSTFIAGFPGETEENFENLCDFIQKAKLFNAGFFAYSREEGTPAFKLDGQLPAKVKKDRVKKLYKIQKEIVKEKLSSYKGKTLQVICDGIDYEKQSFYGRAYFSAPIVDGLIYFNSDQEIIQGETYMVKIEKIKNYDLYGGVINEYTK
jgi:ribosomal protein S12 methylthiotransferase